MDETMTKATKKRVHCHYFGYTQHKSEPSGAHFGESGGNFG